MKRLFLSLILVTLLILPVHAFTIFADPGTDYIRWTWTDDDTAIYKLSLDGGTQVYYNLTFPAPAAGQFIQSDLNPGSFHSIDIIDDIGDSSHSFNSSYTLVSNQDAQWTGFLTLLNTWWYLILIAVLCAIGMLRKLGIFLIVASVVSLYALYVFIHANTIQQNNVLTELPFLIYIVFVVFPLFLCFIVKGGVTK